ncbi:glycoside hydrolase family 2 protein [Moesziomyces antarcticus]|uniref:Glycoside hydrolase family 2 protein n=1 Tax=Pseudozyma antarctica TaxID=84753 RepID=A0A5C3FHC3_PSEA2|nr:glycoside hydrolase family 2 protein [Moesziomyces antarcticus]GAK62724.1 glycoside hydrolase family 2 protein [Moesziomyces antarcticus]SPO43802.1 uncharacterized protein PSANT_01487 [Moesziomyces antarcticus]
MLAKHSPKPSKDRRPNRSHPDRNSAAEYDPNPRFRREKSTLDLTGVWDFAADDDNFGLQERWYEPGSFPRSQQEIFVPYTCETSASQLSDRRQHKIVWYRRDVFLASDSDTIKWSEARKHRYFIHFGAVDYESTVWIQGRMVGSHVGGHTPFSFEITEHVWRLHDDNASSSLEIVVRAKDAPQDMSQPRGKQYWKQNLKGEYQPESIFYTPTTGIWQDVYLARRPLRHIRSAQFVCDIDTGTVRAETEIDLLHTVGTELAANYWVQFIVKLGRRTISVCKTRVSRQTDSCTAVINVRQAGEQPEGPMRTRLVTPGVLPPEMNRDRWDNGLALWSPESPSLYTVEMRLLSDDSEEDRVQSYFGMRKVSIDDQGRFCLNNRVYFQKLILNQGYWPEGGMTTPFFDGYADDIRKIKQMGFNGVRMHQKVESPEFLFEADRLGLLVWGEMANAYEFSTTYLERFTREWIEVVRRDMSHPCIVVWVPINESWGAPALNTSAQQRAHLASLYHLTKALDPTRPVVDNDGWQHVATDLITVHDYRNANELAKSFSSREQALQERVPGFPILLGPLAQSEERYRLPLLCTEFGGLALRVDNVGTTAKGVDWGYANASSQADFLEQFEALVHALTRPSSGTESTRLVQGFCYTQFADVEQEVNGLLTKDREFKIPPAKIKAILDAI